MAGFWSGESPGHLHVGWQGGRVQMTAHVPTLSRSPASNLGNYGAYTDPYMGLEPSAMLSNILQSLEKMAKRIFCTYDRRLEISLWICGCIGQNSHSLDPRGSVGGRRSSRDKQEARRRSNAWLCLAAERCTTCESLRGFMVARGDIIPRKLSNGNITTSFSRREALRSSVFSRKHG